MLDSLFTLGLELLGVSSNWASCSKISPGLLSAGAAWISFKRADTPCTKDGDGNTGTFEAGGKFTAGILLGGRGGGGILLGGRGGGASSITEALSKGGVTAGFCTPEKLPIAPQ